jgi:hypothetical protein
MPRGTKDEPKREVELGHHLVRVIGIGEAVVRVPGLLVGVLEAREQRQPLDRVPVGDGRPVRLQPELGLVHARIPVGLGVVEGAAIGGLARLLPGVGEPGLQVEELGRLPGVPQPERAGGVVHRQGERHVLAPAVALAGVVALEQVAELERIRVRLAGQAVGLPERVHVAAVRAVALPAEHGQTRREILGREALAPLEAQAAPAEGVLGAEPGGGDGVQHLAVGALEPKPLELLGLAGDDVHHRQLGRAAVHDRARAADDLHPLDPVDRDAVAEQGG